MTLPIHFKANWKEPPIRLFNGARSIFDTVELPNSAFDNDMRSRVLRRLSPHLKMAYLKMGLGKKGLPQKPWDQSVVKGLTGSSNESRFSELLKKVIEKGEAKYNSNTEPFKNTSFSENSTDFEPEILDAQLDLPVNNTLTRVFDEISGSGDEPSDMPNNTRDLPTPFTTPITTPSTTSSTVVSTESTSRAAPRRKPWIKRRRITYRPALMSALKGLSIKL